MEMNNILLFKIKLFFLTWFHLRPRHQSRLYFLKHFSYNDIKKATDGFRRSINDSTNCSAYRATFPNGHVAVVKEFRDDKAFFYKQVQLLSCLHHRHIVALSGISYGPRRFLVFEDMQRGSLKECLSDPLKTPLNWRTRLQIVVSIASALEYLLFFCDPPIYNVTINSNTILLDENFTAKLSDINLMYHSTNQDDAPNSVCWKDQMWKDIMFQLGLLILELITGQCSGNGGIDLVQWVQQSGFWRFIPQMIDPDLGNNFDSRELNGLFAVAKLCIRSLDMPKVHTPHILLYLQKKIAVV